MRASQLPDGAIVVIGGHRYERVENSRDFPWASDTTERCYSDAGVDDEIDAGADVILHQPMTTEPENIRGPQREGGGVMSEAGDAWKDGYISGWNEAAAWLAGAAAGTDRPVERAAFWEGYQHCVRQTAAFRAALAESDLDKETA